MKILIAILGLAVAGTAAAQQYEAPTGGKAAAFASAALLKGPLHTVDETVTIEGGLPRFTIRSKYGTWEARGVEMLGIRVAELPAFAQLEGVSRTDAFVKAAGSAIAAPIQATGQLIDQPIDTAGNVLSGIGTMLGRAGRVAGSAATRVGDTVTDSSPQQKPILKPIAPPVGTAAPRAFTGDPLGYNAARREWAKKLNVDTYTFNAPLADKLGQMASASFAGSFPVDLGIGAVAAPLHYATEANTTAQLETYQLSPVDVEARNSARLAKMGIEGLPVRTLFRNGYFTPTLQTALVLALESLGNVPGHADVIAFAARAASENEARYVINSVVLLAQHSRKSGALARITTADNVITGITRDGMLVVAGPIDYVAWVPAADDFARRTDLKGSERLCSSQAK